MPSGFSALDTGFPNLKGMKSTDDQLDAVESYLYQLIEQLRWTLNHLDQSNFNQTEVIGWLGDVITEPVRIAIENITDGLIARLDIDEASLSVLYSKTGINDLGQNETLYSRIDQTAENITTTVASATYQYDTGATSIDYYGYGSPVGVISATGNNGKKYLDQETGDWYTCNGSAWSKSGTFPLLTSASSLVSTINQGAGKIESSVVKIDNNTTLASYVTQTDTAIQSRVTQTDMQTALTQTAGEIMLDVHGEYADEWTSGHSYYKDDVVKITTRDANNKVTAVAFYKAKSNHTSSNANKPPNGTYWTVVSAPNVQTIIDASLDGITLSYDNTGVSADNASHITLSKDGIEIAANTIQMTNIVADSVAAANVTAGTLDAGVVYSGTISADNVTTGTLAANDITMDGEFAVQRTVTETQHGQPVEVVYPLGYIGGREVELFKWPSPMNGIALYFDDDNYIIATEKGCQMHSFQSDITASYTQEEQGGGVILTHPYSSIDCGNYYVSATWNGVIINGSPYIPSDLRVKDNVDYDMTALEPFFRRLKPCTFQRTDIEDGKTFAGFIAQDVQEALESSGIDPDKTAVVGKLTGQYGFGPDDPKLAVRYEEFIALQTHMIQKLMERVDALEKKLEGSNAP